MPHLYIVDRVVLRPGRVREFIDAYVRDYVPGARSRGLELDRILVTPPVWVDGEEHTVTATWLVDGPGQWWQAAVAGRHDPAPARWWHSMAELIIDRTHSTEARAEEISELSGV